MDITVGTRLRGVRNGIRDNQMVAAIREEAIASTQLDGVESDLKTARELLALGAQT